MNPAPLVNTPPVNVVKIMTPGWCIFINCINTLRVVGMQEESAIVRINAAKRAAENPG